MKLYTPIEIEQFQQDLPYLIEIIEWIKGFLAKPHADLGRKGLVCPFVPQALKSNSIYLAVIPTKNSEPQQVEEAVLRYRNLFLETEPKEKEAALHKAFLLIFPDIDLENTTKLIDAVQQKLKPFFVASGLMIGEFHQHNDTAGLHNRKFRPLRSPIPLIAIRFMVESDLPFLQNVDNPHLRVQYLESYLQHFSEEIKDETMYCTMSTVQQKLRLMPASGVVSMVAIASLLRLVARLPTRRFIYWMRTYSQFQ